MDENPVFCFRQGLLLLQQLTKGNAAIQKIVAFENAFERLLDIITEEGSSDGGKKRTTELPLDTLKAFIRSCNLYSKGYICFCPLISLASDVQALWWRIVCCCCSTC